MLTLHATDFSLASDGTLPGKERRVCCCCCCFCLELNSDYYYYDCVSRIVYEIVRSSWDANATQCVVLQRYSEKKRKICWNEDCGGLCCHDAVEVMTRIVLLDAWLFRGRKEAQHRLRPPPTTSSLQRIPTNSFGSKTAG